MPRLSTAVRTIKTRDLFSDKTKMNAKDQTQYTPSSVLVGEHGRYLIKSGRLAGEYIARAFPKPPTNVRGLIAEAKGATEEAAIAALREVIDAREVRRTEGRRIEPRTGSAVPSTEEYVEAIGQVSFSRPQRAILMALSLCDGGGLTESQMAYAAGYKSSASANRSFTAAGHLIAIHFSPKTASDDPPNYLEGTSLLGFRGEPRNEEAAGNWILHPELCKAIRFAL